MENQDTQISFIIPHYGREEMLQETLDSIIAQQFEISRIEVIVVTQNSELDSSTLSRLEKITSKLLYESEPGTISKMRNIGFDHSSGEYLAFLDADVEIAPNWISSMLQTLQENPNRVIVSAIQSCTDQAPVLEKIRTALSNVHIDCDVQFLPGRNLFLRRKTFELAGGFPEHLVTCEDYYFTQKAAKLGLLFYTSNSTYVHLGEDKDYVLMFKKEIWRGQSNLHSLAGRKIPFSEVPSFLVPIWVLFFALCFMASLLFMSFNYIVLFFILTFFPIALYSIRLFKKTKIKLPLKEILRFYTYYFPARCIGTLLGIFRIIKI